MNDAIWRVTEYYIYLLREVYWLVYGSYPSYSSGNGHEDVIKLFDDIENKLSITPLTDMNSLCNPEVLRDRELELHIAITGVPYSRKEDSTGNPENLDYILESIISHSPSTIPP
jgi:hypothetical protein